MSGPDLLERLFMSLHCIYMKTLRPNETCIHYLQIRGIQYILFFNPLNETPALSSFKFIDPLIEGS